MPISDLTGTTWLFNNVVDLANLSSFSINFSSNGNSYTAISNRLYTWLRYDTTQVWSEDGGWDNGAYQLISITGGTDATNASLIAWLEANATQLPVADLTNTTWELNNALSITSGQAVYDVYFTSYDITADPDHEYLQLGYNEDVDPAANYILYAYNEVYTPNGWVDQRYRTISFTGGTDATNATLIAWLAQNATMQQPTPSLTNNLFFGTNSVSKIYFGSSEVSKIYLGDTLVYEASVTPSGYEIGFRGMSSSTPALTRTGEAVGATWAATSGVINIDGIDISKIFGGYVGNDGEELTWDSANSVYKYNGTTYTGNVFVKINRFFAKAYYENSVLDGYDLYFGDSAPSSDYQDWFLGKDHCIIGCYKARGGGFTNGLQSKQGLSYTAATTANAIVTAYKLNSSTAYSLHEKWYNENAILQVLFMAIFATRQTTDVFPQDTFRHRSNDTRATGYMDSYRASSLFAYEPTGDSGKRGNMFLGIEDFVGWGYELVAGVVLSDANIHTSLDYANFVYSGSYADSGLDRPTTSDYIKELQQSDTIAGLLVPKVASGASGTTYFCDYNYYGAGTMVWYQGAINPYANLGLFCFVGSSSAASSYGYYAARLCGKPN